MTTIILLACITLQGLSAMWTTRRWVRTFASMRSVTEKQQGIITKYKELVGHANARGDRYRDAYRAAAGLPPWVDEPETAGPN